MMNKLGRRILGKERTMTHLQQILQVFKNSKKTNVHEADGLRAN
jgi:hypothetical protein